MAHLQFVEACAIFTVADETRDSRAWRRAEDAARKVAGERHNPKTIKVALRASVELLELQGKGKRLDDLDQKEMRAMVDRINYGASDSMVRRLASWLGEWQSRAAALPEVRMAHRRRLLYFAQRLRDRMELPPPSKVMQAILKGEQPTPWRGERVEGGLPYTRDDEEADVSGTWGSFYHYVEPRNQPSFGELESHLAGDPCWKALENLEAAFKAYLRACMSANEAARQALRAHLPNLSSEDAEVKAESLVMDIYQKGLGSRGYDFTYRSIPAPGAPSGHWSLELSSQWRFGAFKDESASALVAGVHKRLADELLHAPPFLELETARLALSNAMSAFRELLGSNSNLQEMIGQRRCVVCS